MNLEQIINHYRDNKEILWNDIKKLPKHEQSHVMKTIFKRENYTQDEALLLVIVEQPEIAQDCVDKACSNLKI